MTCQWCTYYRRRGGKSLCLAPERAGKQGTSDIEGGTCRLFSPRKTCTSCEHRCSGSDKDALMSTGEACPRWELRKLSSWGGNRRYNTKQKG